MSATRSAPCVPLLGLLALACNPGPAEDRAHAASPPPPEITQRRALIREDGLHLEEVRWRAGDGETGRAWLASWPAAARLHIAAADAVVPFRDLVPDDGTWAAINGGFYESNRPMGLVVTGGAERSALSPRGGSGVLFSTPGGLDIAHRDAWTGQADEALQSIDRLVDAGANLVAPDADTRRTARSAAALGGGRAWLVALAGDRSIRSLPGGGFQLQGTTEAGLTLHELAAFLITAVRAEKALNLDGAVSTQLAVGAGDRRFEVVGEAGTVNAVVLESPGE